MIFWRLQKSNNPFKRTHGWIDSNAPRVNNHPCFLKYKKNCIKMKTCSTAFLVIANKYSARNSLLWQEILMMLLSVPQPLNQFQRTFHGVKITNWFITWQGNCLLTRFNFSMKMLLAAITFLFWILLCCLLNMSSF